MKIAFDAKRMLNNATGLGNHARILANAMMRDFPTNEYLLFSPKVEERFEKELKGNFKILLPESPVSKVLHSWWRSYNITERLLDNMVDIYHGLSNELPLNTHRSGVPSVVTIHDLIFLKHHKQYPLIDRHIYELKTRYATKHADKIIVVSEETKRDLMEMYQVPERKIAVIYQSVDARFASPASEETKQMARAKYKLPYKYILNVGSFFPRKNQLRLVEAFDLLKNETEYHLVLAGPAGGMMDMIKRIIAERNLENRIHVIDNVTNEDMPVLYQCADLLVFPSLFEGFGMPVLEALVSGTPVIATKGGAIEEAAGRGSVLIDPYNAGDIADKISQVLKDKTMQGKMIAEGKLHAQTMSDDAFAVQTMNVYKEVLGKT